MKRITKVSCDSYQDEVTGYLKLINDCWDLEAIDFVRRLRNVGKKFLGNRYLCRLKTGNKGW